MSDVRLNVLKVLKDFGFIGADNGLVPVEVACSTGVLYAKKTWLGFGGYHLTNDFQGGLATKCVKTLISVSGGSSLPKLEDNWVELKSLELGDRWAIPISTRVNRYTQQPEEVATVCLVTVHSLDVGGKEIILYALRSTTEVCVKDVKDLVSVLKLYGANSKGRDGGSERDSRKHHDARRDDRRREDGGRTGRRDDRRYRDDYRDWRGGGRGRR